MPECRGRVSCESPETEMAARLLDAQVTVDDLWHVFYFLLPRCLPWLLLVFRRQAHSMSAVGSKPSRLPYSRWTSHNPLLDPVPKLAEEVNST
ncbi:hypothetical protein HPB50_005774 [Hyalomma asiaticum]|uniref:Uncharacterized protein n=1 Tax=Hyalomma asiaticum TaxID=266040 RepID=A0ACB7T1B8_HYAAI|nr:hypothetical protein HPB50_005774 [Hyalomma asiaticum]